MDNLDNNYNNGHFEKNICKEGVGVIFVGELAKHIIKLSAKIYLGGVRGDPANIFC